MIISGKSKDEILSYMDQKAIEQKQKDQKRRAEQEIQEKLDALEQKVRTAEFYFKNGKITEEDFKKILKARDEMLEEINKAQKEQTVVDNKENNDEEEN